ncbi:hypothetical protein GBAR_LOCUS31810, partial [Geodia barretti]
WDLGIADVLVVKPKLGILAVGEVKGDGSTGEYQILGALLMLYEEPNVYPVGFSANEHTMSIYQYVPGGKATEDMRYKLRRMKDTVTFQRKDYLTQDLQQVISYVDDLLTLLQHVESELRQAIPPTPVDRDISSRNGINRSPSTAPGRY